MLWSSLWSTGRLRGWSGANWEDQLFYISACGYVWPIFICRFYGKSHPTKDTSNENLQYLSSQQALADFAYFHDEMVIKYNMTERNKWIVFGGSYSGALAAWFRQMYPNKVVGAIASSAPVLAKLDFVEYVEVVEDSLLATSGRCGPSGWVNGCGLRGIIIIACSIGSYQVAAKPSITN